MPNSLQNVGHDPSVTRTVIFMISTGLLASMIAGGIYLGVMRENINQNRDRINDLQTSVYIRINDLKAETNRQDALLDELRSMAIHTQAVVDTIHGEVRRIGEQMDRQQERQQRRLELLEDRYGARQDRRDEATRDSAISTTPVE